jgi:hypothetical protein
MAFLNLHAGPYYPLDSKSLENFDPTLGAKLKRGKGRVGRHDCDYLPR